MGLRGTNCDDGEWILPNEDRARKWHSRQNFHFHYRLCCVDLIIEPWVCCYSDLTHDYACHSLQTIPPEGAKFANFWTLLRRKVQFLTQSEQKKAFFQHKVVRVADSPSQNTRYILNDMTSVMRTIVRRGVSKNETGMSKPDIIHCNKTEC